VPYVYLNLTKANKDIELKCNPEFELDITLRDKEPYYNGTFKQLYAVFQQNGFSYSPAVTFNDFYIKQVLQCPQVI
jgi:hypothetical protein